MSERGPAQLALESFHENARMAEMRLSTLQQDFDQTQQSFIVSRWFKRRSLKKQIAETNHHLEEYRQAEEGLIEGDFTPAINTLNYIADEIDESPYQTAFRVASQPPTLVNILNSPVVMADKMRRLARELSELQNPRSG